MQKLFLKELRENRMLPVSFALLLCLLMAALKVLNGVPVKDTPGILFGAWMFAAIFAGAGLISREVGSDSLKFLMALPVSRSRVWWIKAVAGLVVTLASMVSTFAAWALAQGVLYSHEAFSSEPLSNLSMAGWFFPVTLSCYCLSLAISTLLDRSISAAMVGVLATAALSIPMAYGSSVYSYVLYNRYHTTENVALASLALAPAFLLASYWAFMRGESLRTGRRFSFAALGCSLGLLVGWTILLGTGVVLGRFHRFDNLVADAMLSRDGQWVVVRALDGRPNTSKNASVDDPQDYHSRHLVVEPVGAGEQDPRRHVWPGSRVLDWSPDGRYLVYINSVGPLGLNLTAAQLMVGDVLSGDSHRIPWIRSLSDYSGACCVKWSPDGRWLAICDYGTDEVQFVSRTNITGARGDIDHHRLAAETVPYANYETPEEQRSRRFSMSHSGTLPQPQLQFRPTQGGEWGADSRYFYTLRTSVLVAIDPLRAPLVLGEPIRSGVMTGKYPKGIYPLCTVPPFGSVEMETSADLHRSLVRLLIGSETPINDGFGKQTRPWKTQIQAIIDLPAATEAAIQRDQGDPLPAVETWLRQCSSHSIPASCAQGSLSISPDGRYLALWQHDPFNPPGHHTQDVSSIVLFSVDGGITHPASHGATAGSRNDWLPGGHRYSITDLSNVLWTTDAETGASQSYRLGDGKLLGIAPGDHLMLAPTTINDAFSPLQAPLSISVGQPGDKK